jgi:hypothetical protein
VPVSGKTVQFSVNGNIVGTAVTGINGIATSSYTILQNSGTYTILAEFAQDTTYAASSNTNKLNVILTPTASATPKGGLYNTDQIVTLTMNELGTIYYTTNGNTPTISSAKYTTPFTITKTTTLKYLAVDKAGNPSTVYTQTYTIDTVPPTVSTTIPTNLKTGVSRTSTIVIKFNENIKASTYYNSIKVKNLTTGKYITITKAISGTYLNIKTSTKRTANTWYQIIIPKSAIKDLAGNNLAATYPFKFKTVPVKNVYIGNNIKISNKGSGKIFYDYKITITQTNGKVTKKTIAGYLNANTSRNVRFGSFKSKTKIGIIEDIYNKANVKKNIDIINQIIISNKVIYTQRVQKQMVTPSPDNILYPVKF